MNKLEAFYVDEKTINDPNCYNMITGGWQDNNPHVLSDEALNRRSNSIRKTYAENGEEIKQKCREASKKIWQNKEYVEKCLAPFKKWSSDPELLKIKGKLISATLNDENHREAHMKHWAEVSKIGRENLKKKMESPDYRRSDSKYILCITTGETFTSLREAIKAHGGHIIDVCQGNRNATRDRLTNERLTWKYITEEEFNDRRQK